MMRRMLACGLMMAAIGSFSGAVFAAASQSLHFPIAPPLACDGPADDLGEHLKAKGFAPIQTGPINLASADTAADVSRKGSAALCEAAFDAGFSCSGILTAPVTACNSKATCCENLAGTTARTLTLSCVGGLRGEGFDLVRTAGAVFFSASATAGGDIANMSAENKNNYNDIGVDLGNFVLVQARSNGVLGNVVVRIFHGQGGPNPKIATFTINAGNVGNPTLIADGIRDAVNALAFAPDVVATTRPASDAIDPLTYARGSYYALPFVRIDTPPSTLVNRIELAGVVGHGLTIETTENTEDKPALGTWGFIAVLTLLLISGYWLMRRKSQTAMA